MDRLRYRVTRWRLCGLRYRVQRLHLSFHSGIYFYFCCCCLGTSAQPMTNATFSYGLLAAVHDGLILGHIDRAVGWNVATEKTGATGRSRHLPPDDVHPSTGKPSTGHRHAGIDCAAGGRLPVRDESRSHVQQREQILRRRLHPFDGQ